MNKMDDKETILEELNPLFEQAEKEGKWFFSQSLAGVFWFSPAELKTEHENEKFIWSAANWELRNPNVQLLNLKDKIYMAHKKYDEFLARIATEIGQRNP